MPQSRTPASSKSANICFIDSVKKAQQNKPGFNDASAHKEWLQGIPQQKGRFGKYRKITITEECVRGESERPGPANYTCERDDVKNSRPAAAYKL
jgi:hypothetical protein